MSENPIDLSRRSDSVETRKTPSPYNSSSFTETSPSLDSPTTSRKHKRSVTPTNCYQSNDYVDYPAVNYTKHNRVTPSPPPQNIQHRYIHETVPSSHGSDTAYYLNGQQTFRNGSSSSSPEAEPSQYPLEAAPKSSRPFKLFTEDPLSLTTAIPNSSNQYGLFRQQMLNHLYPDAIESNTSKMRRITRKSFDGSEYSEMDQQHEQQRSDHDSSSSKGQVKDVAYYERRRKNNVAAKKSRDRRRMKESELAIRAAFLQRENLELKCELAAVKRQLEQYVNA